MTSTTTATHQRLLTVRVFVILAMSLLAAALVGTGAGFIAAQVASTARVVIGLITGFGAFVTTFVTVASQLHGLLD